MTDERELRDEDVSRADGNQDFESLTNTVRDLVSIMKTGDLERIEVTRGDLHILLCARTSDVSHPAVTPSPVSQLANAQSEAPHSDGAASGTIYHEITSPMVGTYYEAPSPGEPPFVRPGDTVSAGQTVAIIEAMKIMNEIVSDRAGVIEEVLVENGETVEFGHPLFRLRPA